MPFLADGQRHRILEMRAADLHDVRPAIRLPLDRLGELRRLRQQQRVDRLERGDVHCRREGVVRGLAHVDVVIGPDRMLAAERAAQQLDRAVRDHLVDVHVRLGAGAGLPNKQRVVRVERAGDGLVGGAQDGVALPVGQPAGRGVDQRAGLLDHAIGVVDGLRHEVAADVEMQQRTLGLRTPVAVGRNLHVAHGIEFPARAGGIEPDGDVPQHGGRSLWICCHHGPLGHGMRSR